MLSVPETATLAAITVAATAAVIDARTGRIPNALTLPSAVLALVFHACAGWTALLHAVAGFCLVGLVPFALFQMTRGRALGGGDVKLFAALGAWTGPLAGLRAELSAFVLVGAFALVRLAFRGELLRVLRRSALLLAKPLLRRALCVQVEAEPLTEVRMGPAIFAGSLAAVLFDQLEARFSWFV